jgi:hypothetical protein
MGNARNYQVTDRKQTKRQSREEICKETTNDTPLPGSFKRFLERYGN